jgi:hypothetical protein
LSSQYFLSFFKTEKSFLCGEIDWWNERFH